MRSKTTAPKVATVGTRNVSIRDCRHYQPPARLRPGNTSSVAPKRGATQTLYLNLRERAAEFATLRAVGWPHRRLLSLLAWEAVTIGALGGLTGAIAGLAALAELTGTASRALPTTVAAGSGGIAVAALAAAAVACALSKLPITELLA